MVKIINLILSLAFSTSLPLSINIEKNNDIKKKKIKVLKIENEYCKLIGYFGNKKLYYCIYDDERKKEIYYKVKRGKIEEKYLIDIKLKEIIRKVRNGK